jgi:hypothetical protein
MKDELKKQLDDIFAATEARKQEAQVKRDLEAEAQAAFLEEFRAKVADVITPAFQEFADYIAPHGWTAVVEKREETPPEVDRQGRATGGRSAAVALKFSHRDRPASSGDMLSNPGFTMMCAKTARTVEIHENTVMPGSGGMSGGGGSAKLDEINGDYLQTKLVAFFKKLSGNLRDRVDR